MLWTLIQPGPRSPTHPAPGRIKVDGRRQRGALSLLHRSQPRGHVIQRGQHGGKLRFGLLKLIAEFGIPTVQSFEG